MLGGGCEVMLVDIGIGCMDSEKQVIQQAKQFNSGHQPEDIKQPRPTQELQQIGDCIVAAAKQLDAKGVGPKTHFQDKDRSWMFSDIHWELVNSKTVNAFTTGGHYVYIYDALFQMCKNEDELAAVMSHEYGHIYCRHVQKGTGRQEALAVLTVAAAGAAQYAGGTSGSSSYTQYAATAAQAGGAFVNNGFTRQDEAQADEYGFKFYTRAGWPPDHFADFFKDMIAAGYDKTPGILSDHPTLVGIEEGCLAKAHPVGGWSFAKNRPDPLDVLSVDIRAECLLEARESVATGEQDAAQPTRGFEQGGGAQPVLV